MPYEMRKSGSGVKVHGPSGPKSKKPISKEMAKKQITAISMSKARKAGHKLPPKKEDVARQSTFISEDERIFINKLDEALGLDETTEKGKK